MQKVIELLAGVSRQSAVGSLLTSDNQLSFAHLHICTFAHLIAKLIN
jgi:hypothetical protein